MSARGGRAGIRTFASTCLAASSFVCLACEDGSAPAGGSGVDPTAVQETGSTSAAVTTSTGATTTSTTSDRPPASTSSTTSESEAETAPPPEPPITWDLGIIPDSPGEQIGCQAVDFLFVIDNSGSMGAFQANLISNFGAFIEGIQSTLTEVESYHIGVTTSDAYVYNAAGCRELGALVVQTGGEQSSFVSNGGLPCGPYAEGANYMTEADDLGVSFSCAAQIGISGSSSELVMDAARAAIDGTHGDPGECNEGFIRDDALLVLVIITDEADGPGDPEGLPPFSSSGDPMTWYNDVIAAKLDIPENAAALALVNYADGPCVPLGTLEDGANIVEFISMFGDNGFLGGICEDDYGPIFTEAVAIIEGACENFIPN